jgi:hypothetical protein
MGIESKFYVVLLLGIAVVGSGLGFIFVEKKHFKTQLERYSHILEEVLPTKNDNDTFITSTSKSMISATMNGTDTSSTMKTIEAKDSLPWHVMFSTNRNIESYGENAGLQKVIIENSRSAISMLPRTTLISFGDNDTRISRNGFGYPYLRDMFLTAMSMYPTADSYTYFNHDLIFNASFVQTMDAVVAAAKSGLITDRFLVVGQRTNLDWNITLQLTNTSTFQSKFDTWFQSGELFQDSAQDYFACSPKLWNWKKFPPFVVGRPAYDNWLVNKAVVQYSAVSPIDATETVGVIHQTGKSGNYQGHIGEDWRDLRYNNIIGRGDWARGHIRHCQYHTIWGENGTVDVQLGSSKDRFK